MATSFRAGGREICAVGRRAGRVQFGKRGSQPLYLIPGFK
jgi:hypothetical protein